jgi:RIO-like serine/threonine protein kinase
MKEVNCIKKLGRLIDFSEDESKYSIVEKFVSGRLFKDVLNDPNIEKDVIFDKCQMQLNKIHKELKMSYNNIKPHNIILSDDGEVYFLDFSKAEKLPLNDVLASAARLKDIKDLLLIFRRRMPRLLSSPF